MEIVWGVVTFLVMLRIVILCVGIKYYRLYSELSKNNFYNIPFNVYRNFRVRVLSPIQLKFTLSTLLIVREYRLIKSYENKLIDMVLEREELIKHYEYCIKSNFISDNDNLHPSNIHSRNICK